MDNYLRVFPLFGLATTDLFVCSVQSLTAYVYFNCCNYEASTARTVYQKMTGHFVTPICDPDSRVRLHPVSYAKIDYKDGQSMIGIGCPFHAANQCYPTIISPLMLRLRIYNPVHTGSPDFFSESIMAPACLM